MKHRLFRTVLLGALALPAAFGQISARLVADIPFDFVVSNQRMPAGEYSISQPHSAIVVLHSADHKSTASVITNGKQASKTPSTGKVVFKRYGDQYFLSSVWTPGMDTGRELRPSRLEKEALRAATSIGTAHVALVAKR